LGNDWFWHDYFPFRMTFNQRTGRKQPPKPASSIITLRRFAVAILVQSSDTVIIGNYGGPIMKNRCPSPAGGVRLNLPVWFSARSSPAAIND
jgi:hypothetical protein